MKDKMSKRMWHKGVNVVVLMLMLVTIVLPVILPQPAYANPGPGWWDANWSRKKHITITNTGSALTNYQIMVTVSYDSDMQSDFDDLRFTNASDTPLDYWIESKTDGSSATVWVEVDFITASGDTTIYMYYGNAGVGSSDSGDSTFEFFDDFSGDLGKWTIDAENTDTVSISASAGNPSPSLRHDPDSSQTKNDYFDTRLITNAYKMLDGIIEYEVYLAGTPRIIHQLGWRVQSLNFENGYCWRLQTSAADGGHFRFTGIASWATFGTAFNFVSANTWHSVKEIVSGSTYTGYVDGGSAYSGTDSTKLTADYLVSHVHGVSLDASSYVLVDNIRVRKYVSPEPSVGAPGSEEKNWESYSNSGRTTVSDDFTSYGVYVYMKGEGFDTTGTYKVAYYDGGTAHGGANGAKLETDTYSNDPDGILDESQCRPADYGASSYGTWHAVVYKTTGSTPSSYDLVDTGDAAYVVEDNFTVQEEAIPEFPTVISAIATLGLCFEMYWWMRGKAESETQDEKVRIKGGEEKALKFAL